MNVAVQHFHLPAGTLIEYEGQSVIVAGTAHDGTIVRDRYVGDAEEGRYFVIKDDKLQELLGRHDVLIDQEFSAVSVAEKEAGAASVDHWAARSAEEQRTALQREAWCLAAQSVLKGPPYTETRIQRCFAEIRQVAADRQRLSALGSDKEGAFSARTFGAKSVSNYCKIYFAHRKPHAKLLLSKKPKGNTLPRLTLAENQILDRCCESYLNKSQPAKSSIVALVRREFRQANNKRRAEGYWSKLKEPHENTIRRRLGKFSQLRLALGREGLRAAQKGFSPTQHGIRALKIGEMVELDFWTGDVMTLAKKSGFWDLLTPDLQKDLEEGKTASPGKRRSKRTRQRLFICAAIDVASRMVLGISVAEKPNARTVIEVLDMVTRDKTDISRLAGCKMPWYQYSGIGTIVVDTGPEFFNEEVQVAILSLGASIVYGRAGVPMDKPFVERLFGGLRTRFADELPGKTGYSVDCLVDYDSERMAAFNAEELRHLITRFTVDDYPLEEHAGLFGKRPVDAWKHHERYGVLAPPPPVIRRNATGMKLKRVMSKEGLRICGIPFGDPQALAEVFKRGKHQVEVRIDPNDLHAVTVVYEGQQVHLENQRKDLSKYSLRTWMAAIKKMTATRQQDKVFYEYVLAEHAEWFHQRIAEAVDAYGLPSTEMSPELLDWFEGNFCFRLQVDGNPETVESANMDDLLSGGQGRGVYTAEAIGDEQAAHAAREHDTPYEQSAAKPPDVPWEGEVDEVAVGDASADEGGGRRKSDDAPAVERGAATPCKRFSGAPKGKGKLT